MTPAACGAWVRWGAAALSLCALPSLRPGARADAPQAYDAVVLADERRFDATKHGGVYTVHRVVEIRSEAGDRYAQGGAPEDDFIRIKELSATLRDQDGKEIRRLSDKDIHVVKTSGFGVFHSDRGGRVFRLTHTERPYVFETTSVVELRTLFVWPDWRPQEDVPVQRAEMVVRADPGVEFGTKGFGVPGPERTTEGRKQVWTWRVGPLDPEKPEDHEPPEDRGAVGVRFAPREFEVEGTRGNLDAWSGLAAWYAALSAGRAQLDEAQRREVRALVKDDMSPAAKVAAVYAHLQQRCRYVAIELGVGGWRPHEAKETFRNRYGDCKDLSTLMVAMLAAVDVKAYPALTLTRTAGVVEADFPSSSFNHCTVLVPGDSTWIECTSKFHRVGDLPASVEGADALVVTEDGGFLARMPVSAADANRVDSVLEGTLGADGALTFSLSCTATGDRADDWRTDLFGVSAQQRRDWARDLLAAALPSVALGRVDVTGESADAAGPMTLRIQGTAEGFASRHTGGAQVNPAVLRRARALAAVPPEERRTPVFFPYAYVQHDSVAIRIPAGLWLQGTPPPDVVTTAGSVRTTCVLGEDRTLRWGRELRLEKREVPREEYPEVARLLAEAARRDHGGIALVGSRSLR